MASLISQRASSSTCICLLDDWVILFNLVAPIFIYFSLYQSYDSGLAVNNVMAKAVTTETAVIELVTGQHD
jgi:hypothetical protein